MTMTSLQALYHAVERIEQHLADKQYLLDLLRAGHKNEPFGSPLRARLARDIAREVAAVDAMKAERDDLRAEITRLRREFERRGWRQCSRCKEYKPPDAFGPDRRMADGLHSHCRACRAAWIWRRRHRE